MPFFVPAGEVKDSKISIQQPGGLLASAFLPTRPQFLPQAEKQTNPSPAAKEIESKSSDSDYFSLLLPRFLDANVLDCDHVKIILPLVFPLTDLAVSFYPSCRSLAPRTAAMLVPTEGFSAITSFILFSSFQ